MTNARLGLLTRNRRSNSWAGGLFALLCAVTFGIVGCGSKSQPTGSPAAPSDEKGQKAEGGRSPSQSDGAKGAPTEPITRAAPSHIMLIDKWAKHVKGAGTHPFAFSPDGKTLIASIKDGDDFVQKWKVVKIDPESDRPLSGKLPFSEVTRTASDNNLKVLSLPEEQQAVIRDNVVFISRTQKKSTLLAYSAGAEYMALRGTPRTEQNPSVEVWQLKTGHQVVLQSPPKVREDESVEIAFSPDLRFVAQAANYQVQIWELPSGRLVTTLDCAANRYLMFSPDGKWLLTQHFEHGRGNKPNTPDPGKLVLWKAGDWQTHHALHPGGKEFNLGTHCAFSPDGKLLAATDEIAGAIWRVTIWDVGNGTPRGAFDVLEFADLAFSPDGKLLATWGGKLPHYINFWDATGGQLQHRIKSRFPTLTSFSPDGRQVTVLAEGLAALIYDLTTGTRTPFEDEVKKEWDRVANDVDISKPAPPITKAKYDQVKVGMTRVQVMHMLGGTCTKTVSSETFKRDEGKFGYSVITRATVRYDGKEGYALFTFEGRISEVPPLVKKDQSGLK